MKNVIVLILGLFLAMDASAQERPVFRLVSAEDSLPVSHAHLKGSDGNILVISRNDGTFSLPVGYAGREVHISHIGFHDTVWVVPATGNQLHTLILTPMLSRLPSFTLFAEPVNIIPDKPWFVADYLHSGHGLLLLAYPNRKLNNQTLYLLDHNHEVAAVASWREQGVLVADAAGGIWLKGRNITWSIAVSDGEITIGQEQIPTEEFEAGIEKVALVSGARYYFGHYSYDNQWLDYYCYDAVQNKTAVVESAFHPLGLKLRETRHIFEVNEFERRFADMCFFAPVFAPIHVVGNQVVIFNFGEGKMMFFDTLHTPLREVNLPFHSDRWLKRTLLKDMESGRFYVVFEERGRVRLHELDVETGELSAAVTIPSFPYLEKITVHQGHIYFLYREDNFLEYKKIFRTGIHSALTAGTR